MGGFFRRAEAGAAAHGRRATVENPVGVKQLKIRGTGSTSGFGSEGQAVLRLGGAALAGKQGEAILASGAAAVGGGSRTACDCPRSDAGWVGETVAIGSDKVTCFTGDTRVHRG